MVNTLRITSVAAVLLAVVVLASVLGPKSLVSFAMKNDAGLNRILEDPNVVERFKESPANKASGNADQTPMLVKQAEGYHKILDPAPTVAAKPPGPIDRTARTPVTPPPSSAKFTLVGLSHSALYPDESFAYIRLADGAYQWVRKGDQIGHITIRSIQRGSILCWDGNRESEMMVVAPPNTASLLETAVGALGVRNSVGMPPKSGSATSAELNQADGAALNRIANQIKQFQQTGVSGDANDTFPDRAAVMSKLVSDYRSSQVSPGEIAKPGGLGQEPNESKETKPAPKRPGFRSPLTSPQPKTN